MKVFSYQDIGKRDNQEDAIFVGQNLFVISDGMGGHASGELASQAVVKYLQQRDFETTTPNQLSSAITQADQDCRNAGDGRGATCVLVHINHELISCLNVGDSRLYHISNGKIKQITIDQGEGHRLFSFVGGGYEYCQIDQYQLFTLPGDILILCSDGISDVLSAESIKNTVASSTNPAQDLVDWALELNAHDNCSTIVLTF